MSFYNTSTSSRITATFFLICDRLFFDGNQVALYYDDTFPFKTLKSVFSTLKIVLIAKNEGGKDE